MHHIANQEKKHSKCSIKEDYVEFLNKYGIECDERFLRREIYGAPPGRNLLFNSFPGAFAPG
jgi:hypothetical protein